MSSNMLAPRDSRLHALRSSCTGSSTGQAFATRQGERVSSSRHGIEGVSFGAVTSRDLFPYEVRTTLATSNYSVFEEN